MEKNPADVDSPISTAMDLTALRASGKPSEVQLATIVDSIGLLRPEILTVAKGVERLLLQLTHRHSPTLEAHMDALNALRAELRERSSEGRSLLAEFVRAALSREDKPAK